MNVGPISAPHFLFLGPSAASDDPLAAIRHADRGAQVRSRLSAGGDRIRTIGPRVIYAFGMGSGRFTRASGKVGVNENDETRRSRGTDGSNPVPSSGESGAIRGAIARAAVCHSGSLCLMALNVLLGWQLSFPNILKRSLAVDPKIFALLFSPYDPV